MTPGWITATCEEQVSLPVTSVGHLWLQLPFWIVIYADPASMQREPGIYACLG